MKPKTRPFKSIIVLLCILTMSVVTMSQQAPKTPTEITPSATYEGQKASSVEVAGRPELATGAFAELIKQGEGDPFSKEKADATIAALKATGQFQDVQLDLRPEPEGIRVLFVAQPAIYFGVYDFDGGGSFSYSRLLQVSNYLSQEPFSHVDVQRGERALLTFFQRNGYFQSEVRSEVRPDPTHSIANVFFHIKLNRRADFGDIKITGTTPEEAERLRAALQSLFARMRFSAVRPGKNYSLKTLESATGYLERILTKDRYLGAQVRLVGAEYNPETNRADVTFNVQSGLPVNVTIEGAHMWGWTKRKLLPIYQQVGLTPELIQEGRQNLLKYFRSKGYFDVQVETDLQHQETGETVVYKIKKGDRKKVEDVAFVGNEHFGAEELLEHVSVDKAWLYKRGHYDDSSVKTLQAFYQTAGFNQVKVTPQFSAHNGKIVVTFNINEGPQDTVESLRIEGNKSLTTDQIAPDGLSVRPGQPYAQKSIDDDRNKIITHYLEQGYLTASFRESAEPLPGDPHRFQVVYTITEGPQVRADNIVTLGRTHTLQELINRDLASLRPGQPLAQRDLLATESRLYTRGVFDWAQVDPRRPITDQDQEEVIVKLHESNRNSLIYGLGFEMVNRGGSVPSGTVALPGLPPVGLPSTFKTNEHTFKGPSASIQYTRSNFRGKAETVTIGANYGPLLRRVAAGYTNPVFRWTNWTSTFTISGESNLQNPIFNSRLGQVSWQLQRPLDESKTKNLFLRYSFSETGLSRLVIPDIVPHEDQHTRLSTFSTNFVRDTRDNILDAHKGNYQSAQLDFNTHALGSNFNFAKLLLQTAYYRPMTAGIVWANSLRIGLEQAFAGSHVPLSEKFFTGGGSTLRGFPLNGAGPQRTVPACVNPSDPSSCAFIRLPVGGTQLLILNSEFRIPVPIIKKGLSIVPFYDGGNVYDRIGFRQFFTNYTNTVGIGARYATPVGPIRIDIGRNLNRISGINATQIFITLGQAF